MGTGERRAIEAAEQAVASPLLETSDGGRALDPAVDHRRPRPLAVGGQRGRQGRRRRPRTRTPTSSSARWSTRSSTTRCGSRSSRPATATQPAARRRERRSDRAASRPASRASRRRASRREPAPHDWRRRARRARVPPRADADGPRRSRARVRATRPRSVTARLGVDGHDDDRGVVAAGHPLTAEAGARVLREGGNAVDAALGGDAHVVRRRAAADRARARAATCSSPAPGGEPVLLDFFVEAPGRGADHGRARRARAGRRLLRRRRPGLPRRRRRPCGVYGTPAGIVRGGASAWAPCRSRELAAPAARARARGRRAQRAAGLRRRDPRGRSSRDARGAARCTRPTGGCCARARRCANPELADALERLGARGRRAVLRRATSRAAVVALGARARRAAHARGPRRLRGDRARAGAGALPRPRGADQPAAVGGRHPDRAALALLDRGRRAADARAARRGDGGGAGRARRPSSSTGLGRGTGFADALPRRRGSGSTTHISVLDADGCACSVTCTNGEGSGIVVPGTGIHLNNMMGEEDLNPLGFHRHPPGRRMPSMMAPTVVLRDGERRAGARQRRLEPHPLGDPADDRRRRRPRPAARARRCARRACTSRTASSTPSPGIDAGALERRAAAAVARFRALNLFFGGVQAVERDARTGALSGGGDPRRGGAVAVA